MAITITPLTTAVMGAVSSSHSGVASGINNAVARTASLVAIAAVGIVVFAVFNAGLDSHIAAISLTPQSRQALDLQRTKLAGAKTPTGVSEETRVALRGAIADAYIVAFRVAMLICAGLAAGSALVALAMIEGKPPPRPAESS
jgi:hypothetical protein